MIMHPSGIGFGVMVVLLNSRVQNRGCLLTSIPISLECARCYGVFLEADMAKAHMMVLEQQSKGFCRGSNLMFMGQNFKMQKRWWIFCVRICQIDLKHHILVCGGPYNESFSL
jgi:hypothetical protein